MSKQHKCIKDARVLLWKHRKILHLDFSRRARPTGTLTSLLPRCFSSNSWDFSPTKNSRNQKCRGHHENQQSLGPREPKTCTLLRLDGRPLGVPSHECSLPLHWASNAALTRSGVDAGRGGRSETSEGKVPGKPKKGFVFFNFFQGVRGRSMFCTETVYQQSSCGESLLRARSRDSAATDDDTPAEHHRSSLRAHHHQRCHSRTRKKKPEVTKTFAGPT